MAGNSDAPQVNVPHAYRREIDGLRAIAILPVLLFHFQIAGFDGGFVGVDIFFVISGFLIGGHLWAEYMSTGRVRLARFYLRRIRRLAPVYFALIVVCLAIGVLIMLPFDLRELGKEVITSAVYLSNVYFFTQSGYFDGAASDKILLHTWSLSVEEQFYIFLPLTLLAMQKLRRSVPFLLATLGIASLIACIVLTRQSPTATFYLFPFRAWEMLAGVLLAILGHEYRFRWSVHPVLSWGGLGLIAFAVTALDKSSGFPGFWALFPVLGATLIIANGKNRNPINRALSTGPLVFVGLISYSLYLWHWPIVTFSSYYFGNLGALPTRLGGIAAAMVLAYLSWKYIETPTRRAKMPNRWVFGAAALSTIAVLGIGGLFYIKDGLPSRFAPEVRTHIAATRDFNQDWQRCHAPTEGSFAGIEICPIGPDGPPQLLIWGDSHVRAYKEGLEEVAFEHGVPALIIWRAGCAPSFGIEKFENTSTPAQNAACGAANRQIEAALLSTDQFKEILLIGRWAYYAQGKGVGRDTHNTISIQFDAAGSDGLSQAQLFERSMEKTVAKLSAEGRRVFVLRQTPEIFDYDSRIVARGLAHGSMSQGDVVDLASTSVNALSLRNKEADAMLAKIAQIDNATVLDSWPLFCDELRCSAIVDGVAGYFDNNHITNSNARRVKSLFDPVFEAGAQ